MNRARRLAGIVLAAFAFLRCATGDPEGRFGDAGAEDAASERGLVAEGGRLADASEDAPECTRRVVINELSVAGGTAGEEFVELLNAGTCAASIGGWTLRYRSAGDVPGATLVTFDPGQGIVAGGVLLAATATYGDGGAGLYEMVAGLAAGGGQIGLVDDNDGIVDAVGYGNAAGAYVEKNAAPAPPSGASLARTPNGKDTGDNAADFALESTPSAGVANP